MNFLVLNTREQHVQLQTVTGHFVSGIQPNSRNRTTASTPLTQLSFNINSQLDTTIIILLITSISSTCFGRQLRPSSGALDCVYSLWYKAPTMLSADHLILVTSRQHRRCFIPQAVNSLVLLRMGEIIARNMLSWMKLLIKLLPLHLVGCLYYCINDARSHKHRTAILYCIWSWMGSILEDRPT